MITRGNMNRIISNSLSILAGILITTGFLVTCERFEPESELIFRTESVEELDEGGFRVTGRIFHIGDHAILQHGFCWAESDNPTLNDRASQLGKKDSEGTFSSMIEDLSLDRHYFVCAYVTTGEGTEYGKVIDFRTPPPEVPTVITASVGVIDATSARGEGKLPQMEVHLSPKEASAGADPLNRPFPITPLRMEAEQGFLSVTWKD